MIPESLHSRFLMATTRSKMRLMKWLAAPIRGLRRILGFANSGLLVKRQGIRWNLDLSEAIEANLYLTGRYEPELGSLMERKIPRGSTVLDIGANLGAHTLPLAKQVGAKGKVLAIEATDFALSKLRRNLSLNPELQSIVTPIHAFLCDPERSDLPAFVSASWSLNGSLESPSRNALDLGFSKPVVGAETLTLDELVESRIESGEIERVDAIKLDVDGHEAAILRGSIKTLRTFSPLVFIECSPIHYEAMKTSFRDQVNLLLEEGYEFEDVFGHRLPSDATQIERGIPRGTLVNLLARKKEHTPGSRSTFESEERLKRLKQKLTSFMAEQKDSWSYLKVIRPGYASKRLYAIYLIETYHYTFHNSRNQARIPARKEALDIQYMKFCLHHAEEEAGHERMALHDVKALGFPVNEDSLPEPLPATQELIRYLYDLSETGNPLARLGYSFWAERVYDYIEPLLTLMRVGVGIPRNAMSFFTAHSSIDAKHAVEVDRAILRFAKTEEDWHAIESCMLGSLERTIKMTHEVLTEYDRTLAGENTRYDRILKGER
jgi:FkbM family methyltransferase